MTDRWLTKWRLRNEMGKIWYIEPTAVPFTAALRKMITTGGELTQRMWDEWLEVNP